MRLADRRAAAREAKRAEDTYAEIEDLLGTSFAKRERVRALIDQGLAGVRIPGSVRAGTCKKRSREKSDCNLISYMINQAID
jgi:hypothetical protein